MVEYEVEQMSMNSLLLKGLSNNNTLIFSRQYSPNTTDELDKFYEVLDLKKGFWWLIFRGIQYTLGIIGIFYLGYIIVKAIGKGIKWIFNKLRKE